MTHRASPARFRFSRRDEAKLAIQSAQEPFLGRGGAVRISIEGKIGLGEYGPPSRTGGTTVAARRSNDALKRLVRGQPPWGLPAQQLIARWIAG